MTREPLSNETQLAVAASHGSLLRSYEALFASVVGAHEAVAFAYARTALSSILTAIEVGPGDEVVLSPLTCKVVPLALLSLGVRPVYADISTETLNLDPDRLESAIRTATRALLFQHTYGNMAGAEEALQIAALKGVPLVEDCAQSLPFRAPNRRRGGWGIAAIYSNNLRKPLPAGSGGIAVTNDSNVAQRIREVREQYPHRRRFGEIRHRTEAWLEHHVLRPALYWRFFELNRKLSAAYRLRPLEVEIADEISRQALQVSDYQIREGLFWLSSVESLATHRRLCCAEYRRALEDLHGLRLPPADVGQPLYYFPVLVERKQELLNAGRAKQIEIIAWPMRAPIYPIEDIESLHQYGYKPGSCPVAEEVAAKLVGLPTHARMRAEHRARVIELVRSFAA